MPGVEFLPEPGSFLAHQGNACHLWNLKLLYPVSIRSPVDFILGWINLVHTHFNIITLTLRLPQWPLLFKISNYNFANIYYRL
jgi:hypothetical protein